MQLDRVDCRSRSLRERVKVTEAAEALRTNRLTYQLAVAMLGHPPGSSEVALPASSRSCFVVHRISAQHNFNYFRPMRPVGLGIEQTKIDWEMCLIIRRDGRIDRRQIIDDIAHWTIFSSCGGVPRSN